MNRTGDVVMSTQAAPAPTWWGSGPAERRESRFAAGAIAVGIALTPLLRPTLTGTITPVDLTIGMGTLVALAWLGAHGQVLRFPFVVAMGLMIAAGALAAMMGEHPRLGAQAIVQDLMLVAWCVAISNVCRTPRSLSIVIGAWAWSAIVWAALLVVAASTGMSGLAGQEAAAGRASLTFLNPNQAGSYFAVSLMVVLAAGVPRRRPAKVIGVILLGTAMIMTSSNAALGGTVAALLLASVLFVRQRRGVVPAIAAGSIAALVLGAAVVAFVVFDVGAAAKQSEVRIVRNTLGRSERSAEDRLFRFDEVRALYLEGGVLGYGPAATKQALADLGRAVPKSAHNDLFATLVERGILGIVGLALLVGSVIHMSASLVSRRLAPAFAVVIRAAPFLAGGAVTVAVASLSHEVLHFRHVWPLFGIIAALHLWAIDPAPAVEPATRPTRAAGLARVTGNGAGA